MRTAFGRSLPLCGLALLLLVGCTSGVASAPKTPAEFPLFTTTDGYASLNVSLVDMRQAIQTVTDLEDADRVEFTLTSAANLTAPKKATASIALPLPGGATSQPVSGLTAFTGLRPGSDYVLRADIYKTSYTANNLRAQGVSDVITLAAGENKTVPVKINAIGNVQLTASTFGNKFDTMEVVSGDTVTVNTLVKASENPLLKSVEVYFFGTNLNATKLGSVVVPVPAGTTPTTLSWQVPAITGNSDSGLLYVLGYDASNNVIARKSRVMTVSKGASIGNSSQISLD
ncbi:MAG TPA: hypothetical protein V6D00_14950 [Pantanalinema sp.]